MKKMEWLLLIFNLIYIAGFSLYYLLQQNYEFMVYIGAMLVLLVAVVILQRRVRFPHFILWMLSTWGLLHMLGGGLRLPSGIVLYRWIPVELYNAHDMLGEFVILKFDQILHFYIYFVMSFVLAHLLARIVNREIKPLYFYFFVVLGSMGLSVVNELIEFAAVLAMPSTGVGGYYNTLLDLVFNTMGALVGALVSYIWHKVPSVEGIAEN